MITEFHKLAMQFKKNLVRVLVAKIDYLFIPILILTNLLINSNLNSQWQKEQ